MTRQKKSIELLFGFVKSASISQKINSNTVETTDVVTPMSTTSHQRFRDELPSKEISSLYGQEINKLKTDESVLQRSIKKAAIRACIHKRVTCHTLCHAFATHLLES